MRGQYVGGCGQCRYSWWLFGQKVLSLTAQTGKKMWMSKVSQPSTSTAEVPLSNKPAGQKPLETEAALSSSQY